MSHPGRRGRDDLARRLARTFVAVAAGGPLLATALSFAGESWWVLDLTTHFSVQYAVALAAAAGAAAWLRWRSATVVIAVALGIHAARIAPLYLDPLPGHSGSSPVATVAVAAPPEVVAEPAAPRPLTLLHWNVRTSNRDYDTAAAYVSASGADIVFLQEIDPRWRDALEPRLADYTLLAAEPRLDNFGIAMLVRDPLPPHVQVRGAEVRRIATGMAGVPVIEAAIALAGRELIVMSVHALPPIQARCADARDRQLRAVSEWVRHTRSPVVVIGDLNTTPWSWPFRRMMGRSGLINSQCGVGLQPSWPAQTAGKLGALGVLGIPIDHCLHSPALRAVDRSVGPDIGSDHLPLHVTLAWAAAGG